LASSWLGPGLAGDTSATVSLLVALEEAAEAELRAAVLGD
jgi:hypothetical protein